MGRCINWPGIGHIDAVQHVESALNNGQLQIWGRRSLSSVTNKGMSPVPGMSIHFDNSTRPIPKAYWESSCLDPLFCNHISTEAQSIPRPGKTGDCYTSLTLNKHQVMATWPPGSWLRRRAADLAWVQRRDYWARPLDRNYGLKSPPNGFPPPTELTHNRTLNPRLNIVIGKGGNYEHSKHATIYIVTRTVSISVRNDGIMPLSNCKLHCEIKDENNNPKKWLREDAFALNAGEERYIAVASYNESVSTGCKGGDSIQLDAPVGSGYGGFLAKLPKEGGAVTFTASCAQTPSSELVCKFWVTDGKLNWEQA
jgi:hypothetical protein